MTTARARIEVIGVVVLCCVVTGTTAVNGRHGGVVVAGKGSARQQVASGEGRRGGARDGVLTGFFLWTESRGRGFICKTEHEHRTGIGSSRKKREISAFLSLAYGMDLVSIR